MGDYRYPQLIVFWNRPYIEAGKKTAYGRIEFHDGNLPVKNWLRNQLNQFA